MRMKLFLAILFAAFSSPLFAQSGGIKGVVVSRAERALIDDAKVTLLGVSPRTVYTQKGAFEFRDVVPGTYQLLFEAGDFQPLQLGVTVDKTVKDLNFISLVPETMNRRWTMPIFRNSIPNRTTVHNPCPWCFPLPKIFSITLPDISSAQPVFVPVGMTMEWRAFI